MSHYNPFVEAAPLKPSLVRKALRAKTIIRYKAAKTNVVPNLDLIMVKKLRNIIKFSYKK